VEAPSGSDEATITPDSAPTLDGKSAPRTSGGPGAISQSTTSASESPGHHGRPALGSYPRVVRPAGPPQRPDRSPQVATPRSALTAA
jgi:hypothetical protein